MWTWEKTDGPNLVMYWWSKDIWILLKGKESYGTREKIIANDNDKNQNWKPGNKQATQGRIGDFWEKGVEHGLQEGSGDYIVCIMGIWKPHQWIARVFKAAVHRSHK